MSFVAAIDNQHKIATWSRACVSLAGVSDQISFTVLASSVTILAVSSSRTTHGEIEFERGFFREITFDTEGVVQDGFSDFGLGPSYSFVVSSKHLVMLLKGSDPHSLNYVCLRVNCSSLAPLLRQYKLSVEILTKKLVLKKYQISFQPVEYEGTDIPARYDALWQENDLYRFTIEAAVIKLFLDTVHALAEDFSIGNKSSNIVFSAYTKQVLKDRDFLKQPMLIAMLMAIDDLQDSNLADAQFSLNFRLRDFRNFIGLVSSLRADSVASDFGTSSIDVLFKTAGDPILFQHLGPDLAIKFIQMTTDDSGTAPKQDPRRYVLHAPVVQKKRTLDPEPVKEKTGKKLKTQKNTKTNHSPAQEQEEYDDFDAFDPFESNTGHVTYGDQSQNFQRPTFHEGSISGNTLNDDTDYTTSGPEQESETEFGPTQARDKPKPLFR